MLKLCDINFDIGDKVYFLSNNKVQEAEVQSICLTNKIEYRVLDLGVEQSKLYCSKEELLKDL